MLRTFGDAFEHTAPLMGIIVHPVATSESVSESTKAYCDLREVEDI